MQFPKNVPKELIENRRKQFENMVPEHLDLERDEVGEYVHKYVRSLWQGFNIELMTDKRGTRRAVSFMIVGRAEPRYPNPIPHKPYKHWEFETALEEANHLASVYPGNTFAVYRPIFTVRKGRNYREADMGGLKRIYTPSPSLYYMYRGHQGASPEKELFLTDDFGTAVHPGHVSQFQYYKEDDYAGSTPGHERRGSLQGHQGGFGVKLSRSPRSS